MSFIEIVGGNKLYGEINIQGSKNAVLPILAATILVKGVSKIHRCPRIRDVFIMIKILESIGCKVWWEETSICVDATYLKEITIPDEYVKEMRSSIILMGALLGRMHNVRISYPGGCTIGKRPIDYHLNSLKLMNVQIDEVEGNIYCATKTILGTDIHLNFPSVGATENVVLAAVLAKGITRIYNAAKEPEIDDLCCFLNQCGAKISGIGTDYLKIEGVDQLTPTEYTVSTDRIVAGTYLAMVAGTGGRVKLNGANPHHLTEVISVLSDMGCLILAGNGFIEIKSDGKLIAAPILVTRPYPGFPTDMQSQMMSLATLSSGSTIIVENIFEDRYSNVPELIHMGADILLRGRTAVIQGVEQLHGVDVYAKDLRAGAALILAGLIAEGVTKVYNTIYIERGYEDICKDLRSLGAVIQYVTC